MKASGRLVAAASLAALLAFLAWVRSSLDLQTATLHVRATAAAAHVAQKSPLFATEDLLPPLAPAPRVHLYAPLTDAAARVIVKLRQPVDLPFRRDTPLEDVIQYIKTATAAPDCPRGLSIYVDPIGLQEAEKTEQSPVRIDLKGVALETGLRMMLAQLGLVAYVDKEGILVITSREARDGPLEPEPLILDTLAQLRAEVAALRWEVASLRAASGQALAPPPFFDLKSHGMGGVATIGSGFR